jgi:large subunit ribosomal protein L10
MPNPEKAEMVGQLKELFKESKGYYVADFTGLNAQEITDLRRRFRRENVKLKVAKNTLARIALSELEHEAIVEHLVGPNAYVIAYEDELAPPRIMKDFVKEYSKGTLKLAYLDGRVIQGDELVKLSKLPKAEQIQANLVGALKSPIYGLVWSLKGLLTSLVLTLNQIAKSREEDN